MYYIWEISRNKWKKHSVSKIVLTVHYLNKLFKWSQKVCKFSVFILEFQKFFSVNRTFFSHSRSEQCWKQNTNNKKWLTLLYDDHHHWILSHKHNTKSAKIQRKGTQIWLWSTCLNHICLTYLLSNSRGWFFFAFLTRRHVGVVDFFPSPWCFT